MSYTFRDINDSMLYSDQRLCLAIIQEMYNRLPHITSHMQYKIRPADPEQDYYFPSTLEDKAIIIEMEIPQIMCEKLSCNNVKKETECSHVEPCTYYRIGTLPNTFERHCQPACFNLMPEITLDEATGKPIPQMVRLKYSELYGCVIVPPAVAWHEFPFYRANEKYILRQNDLPAGFDYGSRNDFNYSGIDYTYNKTYCDAFFDQWDAEKTDCKVTWYEKFGYAVVGESIIKLIKAGVQMVENGDGSSYPPLPDLPAIPEIELNWTVEGWKNDINTSFEVPAIDYSLSKHGVCDYIINPIKSSITKKKFHFLKRLRNVEATISASVRRKLEQKYIVEINHKNVKLLEKDEEDSTTITEVIGSIIGSIFLSLGDINFWLDIGFGLLGDVSISLLKDVAKKLADELIPKLTKKILENITEKVYLNTFKYALMGSIAKMSSKIIVKSISKVFIYTFKLLGQLASVVGIIFSIITIFDILFTIIDPLNFNYKYDKTILKKITTESEQALKMGVGMPVPAINFELLSNLIIDNNKMLDICLQSYDDIYEYLSALTINAEGSRIDRGPEINLNEVNQDELTDLSIIKSKYLTQEDIYHYEQEHIARWKFYNFIKPYTICSGCLAIAMLCVDQYVLCVFFIIIALTLTYLTYLNAELNIGKYVLIN